MKKIMGDIMPTEFQLNQNYPNPFKKKTTIRYCVPYKTRIGVEVYDSSRNKVKTLIKEIKEAGTYKVEIDAAVFPSGVYFYRLQAGDVIETKKMILLR
jgi:hypothetical protein